MDFKANVQALLGELQTGFIRWIIVLILIASMWGMWTQGGYQALAQYVTGLAVAGAVMGVLFIVFLTSMADALFGGKQRHWGLIIVVAGFIGFAFSEQILKAATGKLSLVPISLTPTGTAGDIGIFVGLIALAGLVTFFGTKKKPRGL